jgi:hypothetical protein
MTTTGFEPIRALLCLPLCSALESTSPRAHQLVQVEVKSAFNDAGKKEPRDVAMFRNYGKQSRNPCTFETSVQSIPRFQLLLARSPYLCSPKAHLFPNPPFLHQFLLWRFFAPQAISRRHSSHSGSHQCLCARFPREHSYPLSARAPRQLARCLSGQRIQTTHLLCPKK